MKTSFTHIPFISLFLPFFLMALWLYPGVNLYGQTQDTLDLSELSYDLSPLSAPENVIHVEFSLGSVSEPVSSVPGYELNLQFPNLDSAPDNISVSLVGSVIGTSGEGTLAYQYFAETNTLNISYELANNALADANGWVLEAELITSETLTQDQKLAQVADGIIMVENMELKRFPASTHPSSDLLAYPNPFQEKLCLSGVKGEMGTVDLRDLQGKTWYSVQGMIPSELALEGIPAGMYVLEVQWDAGRFFQQKIMSAGRRP